MTRRWFVLLPVVCLPVWAAEMPVSTVLRNVEERYNRIKTLQVRFEESYRIPGRPKRVERGDLLLRKPGKMRWNYSDPAGKLFVSDGKDAYFYVPGEQRAEKMKLKETEDMRAPLAFLLGRLDFQKEFKDFRMEVEGPGVYRIHATPKSDRLPYQQVDFTVGRENQIQKLSVLGQDQSTLEFVFQDERVDPKIADKEFQFVPPAGVELIDAGSQKGGA